MTAYLGPAALALQAFGTLQSGFSEGRAYDDRAAIERENGRLAYKDGEEGAMDVLREALFAQGAAAADMASSGLVFGGSIGTVLADSARAAEIDIDRLRTRARGEAANAYAQAAANKAQGRNARVGSIFSAVAGAVSGAADMRHQRRMEGVAANERAVRLNDTGSSSYGWTPSTAQRRRWAMPVQ